MFVSRSVLMITMGSIVQLSTCSCRKRILSENVSKKMLWLCCRLALQVPREIISTCRVDSPGLLGRERKRAGVLTGIGGIWRTTSRVYVYEPRTDRLGD